MASTSPAASAVPAYLHLMVFVILILGTALFLGFTGAVLGYRNRLLAGPSTLTRTDISLRTDLENGKTTQSGAACKDCKDDIKPGTGLIESFLRWRRRVLYESDSVPELALLPSYKPKETAKRKILNFVLRKKRIIPDPPTLVTITRVIEAAEARERAAAAAAVAPAVVAKADVPAPPIQLPASPPPSFQIPAIIVQCWDTPVDAHALANPILPPSCSTSSSFTTSSTSSCCRTPPECLSASSSNHALSPAVASPAAFFFPSFPPSASMSSFDYLHVPPPSWGSPAHGHIADPVLADVSNVSGARFVLGPPPPPRALFRSKGKLQDTGLGEGEAVYSPPLACVALATSAPLKTVEGERRVRRVTARSARSATGGMPRTSQEGVVGIVSASGGVPLDIPDIPARGNVEAVADRLRSVPGSGFGSGSGFADSDDPHHSKRPGLGFNEETEGALRAPPEEHARASRADPDVSALLEQILSSSSTTSSLVDLILEAIAAETDESFHYTTVSSSFSSSPSTSSSASRASTSSAVSYRSGASWASDEDEERAIVATAKEGDRDGHRSFLMLEDESDEEDFLDSVLSAYIRNDDDNYSLNTSSGSDYGDFDDIDLCGDPDRDPTCVKTPGSGANVKGLLPPCKKFLAPLRVVHPGFAI
uniref:Atg26p n=1 Tax=Ganoderma boninense TaxID=34458 RepID=A0A5K1JYH1_9APHY|nr:Atg26p [Ganoderma boninense]